jgi:4-amino-4-deoxy-L-arabinose transferase-like glycosyltransferase
VYWTSSYFENQFYSENLFVFLFLAANLFAFAGTLREGEGFDWRLPVAGLLYGLAVLCRPSAVAAVPLVALWLLWVKRHSGRRALAGSSILIVFAVLALVPWWVRNYTVHGAFLPFVSSGGLNFWAGNEIPAGGGALSTAWSIMRENPGNLTEIGLDRWFYRDAMAAIQRDPTHFIAMMKQKALSYGWPLQESFYQLPYRLLSGFFLLGLGVSLKAFGRSMGLYLVVFSQFIVSVAYAAHSRYRYAIDFYLIVLAAVGLVGLLRFAPRGKAWVGKVLALFLVAAGVLGWILHTELTGLTRVWMAVPVGGALVLSGWAFLPGKTRD